MLSYHNFNLVQRDPALPGLRVLLDPEAFQQLLGCWHPHGSPGMPRIVYIRYKPQTSCLVAFRVALHGVEVDVYAKAHRREQEGKLHKSRKHSGLPELLSRTLKVLDEHAISISVFPWDRHLRSLASLDGGQTQRRLLAQFLPNRPDLWDGELRTLRYNPERRYVAQLTGGNKPAAVLKFYDTDSFSEAHWISKRFESRGTLRIAKRLGQSRRHRVLAYEWLPGRLLSDVIAEPTLHLDVANRVGSALAELHAQRSQQLQRLTRQEETTNLMSLAADLGHLCPEIADRTNQLARTLSQRLVDEPPVNLPIHGDFYANQVLIGEETVACIDLDSAVLGDPAADLGNFLAHLEWSATRGEFPRDRIEPIRESLLDGYGRFQRRRDLKRIDLYTVISLLRLAPHHFRRGDPIWPERIESTLSRTEGVLNRAAVRLWSKNNRLESVGHALDVKVSDPFQATQDPCMPALEAALDPITVQRQFEKHLRRGLNDLGPWRLQEIGVTRHKPGRRCLVEYDLSPQEPGGPIQSMTLVGKIRAKGLKRSQHRVQKLLWRAGFSSDHPDAVSVPKPIGVVPEFQMCVQRKVPGVAATHLLAEPGGVDLARRIAFAIHKVHKAGVRTVRRHGMPDELRILHDRLARVVQRKPEWQARIRRLLQACDRIGAQTPAPKTCGIHRDFYPDQVLVDGKRLHLLDFDLYCEGDPALDVGNFCAHLIEHSVRTTGSPDAMAQQQHALVEQFVELSGESVRPAIGAYTTLTLVRHIYLSTQFPQRRPFTETLLQLCEERCRSPVKRPN